MVAFVSKVLERTKNTLFFARSIRIAIFYFFVNSVPCRYNTIRAGRAASLGDGGGAVAVSFSFCGAGTAGAGGGQSGGADTGAGAGVFGL